MGKTKNFHMIRYGVAEGEIKFGHIHTDNVVSACMLRSGFTYKHYITMDGPGGEDFRKHSTTCRSPGAFQVKAGEGVPKNQPGIFLDAENGDIVIRAANGRVRIEGIDVDIRANGSDGKRGNVIIDANDAAIMKGQVVDVNAKASAKFFSEKSVEISGTTVVNIYGGFIDMADGATSVKGSKNPATGVLGTAWEIRNKLNAFSL
tara:strand:+ start:526 stop:1137 length:612 start_codon:yes stop_codon:yes gene_type:complete